MTSASLLGQVARTAAMAAGARLRMQKRAGVVDAAGKAMGGVGNFLRGTFGLAQKTPLIHPAGNPKSWMHALGSSTLSRLAVGAGGAYGGGMTAYHGLGIGKPPDHQSEFNRNRELLQGQAHEDGRGGMLGQYDHDIAAVEGGTYNPHTGRRHDDWYSQIFGFQGLSAPERRQQADAMRAKLEAARAGTGSLGDYRGNRRGWFGTGESMTYEQARQKAMQAAQSGVNQSTFNPGLMQRALLDGAPRQVSDDARTAMQSFIQAYGPKAPSARPTPAAQRFSYIGGRPTGPIDFSHLGLGSGFGHDYSALYQPHRPG